MTDLPASRTVATDPVLLKRLTLFILDGEDEHASIRYSRGATTASLSTVP